MIAAFLCLILGCTPLPVDVVTVYHAVAEQTDSSPLVTADGSRLTPEIIADGRYCAVSQDLLWFTGGPLHWGDAIWVVIDSELAGRWVVHDTMAASVTGYVDLLVPEGVLKCWVADGAQVRHPGGCKVGVEVGREPGVVLLH